jgi:hypothetical protein
VVVVPLARAVRVAMQARRREMAARAERRVQVA